MASVRLLVAALTYLLTLPGTAVAQGPVFAFEFGGQGTSGPGLLGPGAGDAAVDGDGNVWVVDAAGDRIVKYDYNGSFIAAFTGPTGGGETFAGPRDVAANGDDVYVVDEPSRVVQMRSDGRFVRNIGESAPFERRLNNPIAVAADARGTVYVSDSGASRISVFDARGRARAPITTVSNPGDVAVGGARDIYVTEFGSLHRLSATGTPMRTAADISTGTLRAVETDFSTSPPQVYVADFGRGILRQLPQDLSTVRDINSTGAGPGLTNGPTGVAVDCRGSVYLVDAVPGDGSASKVVKFWDPADPPPPCEPRPSPPSATDIDVQANDLEVTQGVQPLRSFLANRSDTGELVIPRYDELHHGPTGGFGPYYGATVRLAENRTTVVRLYASLRSGPAGGIGGVPATLHAVQRVGGRTIRRGPLLPVAQPPVLRVGDALIDAADRADPAYAYTFVLPPEWTRGELQLTAQVNPSGHGCPGACRERSKFTLDRVRFHRTALATVWPLALTVDRGLPKPPGGATLTSPGPAFDIPRVVTPLPINLFPWLGRIEVGDVARAVSIKTESCFLGIELGITCTDETVTAADGGRWRDALEALIYERIEDWVDDNGAPSNVITIGLMSNARSELPGSMKGQLFNDDRQARGYAAVHRPLTAVAHELQHALGRPHAGTSPTCGYPADQLGEPWPPDEQGFLSGFGLDPTPGSGGGRGPFRILSSNLGGQGQWFDLMSYCAGEGSAWISPRGWENLIRFGAPAGEFASAGRSPAPQAAQSGDHLRVVATARPDGTITIAGVSPGQGAPETADPSSPFVLETRDASGRTVLASTGMQADVLADSGSTALVGDIPAAAEAAMVVVRRGDRAARVLRSANAPRIRLRSPGRRTPAKRSLTVRWRGSDADGGPLTATVEYSADGGRRWRTVSIGESRGTVRLSTTELAPSRRARVRVRLDDGFSEAVDTSARFVVPPSPPQARIVAPVRGQRVRADAPLLLRAEAFAGGRRLRGRALRWFDGRRRIGTGEELLAQQLGLGRRRIRLVASAAGRRTVKSVTVRVVAVKPAFLVLRAPAQVDRRARRVRLTVATTVPSTLRSGRRRFSVNRRTRRVVVPIKPGAGALRLPLRLNSAGKRTSTVLEISRG